MKFVYLVFVLIVSISAFATEPCSKVGESAGGSLLDGKQCCPGLAATMEVHNDPRVSCDLPAMPGMDAVCIKCGDKKCDKKNNENRCSCPQDCK